VLYQLAVFESQAGNVDGAISAYQRFGEVAEGETLIHAALALFGLCQGVERLGDARPLLERARAAAPDSGDVRNALGTVLESLGAHRELAELELADALSAPPSPDRVKALLRAGELFLYAEDLDQALYALGTARTEAPESLEVAVLMARACSRSGRLEEAIQHLDGVLDLYKGKRVRTLAAVYEEKANVHLDEGFLTDALNALAKAFEMDPKNARLGMRLGRLALEAEEDELAQRALRSVAIMKTAEVDGPDGAQSATKADANYALAVIAHRAGDPRKAKILVAKAISENPEHEAARALLAEFDKR
jgi:tetratricopeptide (TPR) repeat protein